jgi:hypothetical protein
MKKMIKYYLILAALCSLVACTATEVKANNETPFPVVLASGGDGVVNFERNIKIILAIDYLEKEITSSPSTLFYAIKGGNLPIAAKDDFIAMIRSEKSRLSEFPSGVYVKIARALQDGFIYAPCNRNGSLNLRCIDFSRVLLLRKQQQMSFDVAKEAGDLNITYIPLAEQYKNGILVKKNLKAAYENYLKDGVLRDSQFRNEDIFKMLNSELRQYDSKVNLALRIDEQTCNTFKSITSADYCSNSDLGKMFDALSIENIISNSAELSQADLKGEWISDAPLAVGRIAIKGFDLGGEGIMYASISNGARNLPSSFKYAIKNNKLEFDIDFSAAGIPVGTKLTFEAWKTKNGSLILKYANRFAVYRIDN